MATYAIGDIQGCFESLKRLLKKIHFRFDRDKLWIAGDLVHRGEDSLGTLRFLYEHRQQVTAVLGNHDLHLLALAHGAKHLADKEQDLAKILRAKDSDRLLSWLQTLPLLVHKKGYTMVHAGIPPSGVSLKHRNYHAKSNLLSQTKQWQKLFLWHVR